MDDGEEGIDCRRVLRINAEAEAEVDRFERGMGECPLRFGFDEGMRDNAEGVFLVGSRMTQVSKLERAYEAIGGFEPSYSISMFLGKSMRTLSVL